MHAWLGGGPRDEISSSAYQHVRRPTTSMRCKRSQLGARLCDFRRGAPPGKSTQIGQTSTKKTTWFKSKETAPSWDFVHVRLEYGASHGLTALSSHSNVGFPMIWLGKISQELDMMGRPRRCRDWPFLVIFFAWIGGLTYLGITGAEYGVHLATVCLVITGNGLLLEPARFCSCCRSPIGTPISRL
jgi:hypothetical protein